MTTKPGTDLSLLKQAIMDRQKERVQKFLSVEVDEGARFDLANLSIIHFDESIFGLILQKFGIDLTDGDGNTLLHVAAKNGNPEATKILIKASADVNQTNKYEFTALHWAARKGHFKTVELLLNSSADVNQQNKLGETALH